MKKKLFLAAIASFTLFIATTTVASTLSWLSAIAVMENEKNPIEGTVEDEYYASGIGTAGDPFIITKPRHLYNLAWLQYLGFYNKNTGTDDHQFYFRLGDNIDMSQFGPIPPIGTELNPFVGNFDGRGYVISNLTISNTFTDYVSHPSAINAWDNNTTHKQPHILGFFGVIGEYPGGNKNSTYSTSVNELKNTGLTGVTIKTELTDSLAGVAAGYVRDSDTTDSHNVLSNVLVDNSSINLPQTGTTSSYGNDVGGNALTKISEYSLVGYTNNKSPIVKASKSLYGVNVDNNYTFNATESGNVNGWGGSVDMKSVLERLITIKGTKSKAAFPFKKTITHHESGGTTDTQTTNTQQKNNAHTATLINDNDQIGHFLFLHRNDDYDPNYAMFGGGHYQTDIYYDLVDRGAFQITNGTQYLKVTSTTINKTETASEGSYWAQDANGRLFTKSGDTYYYLRNNNGTLQATATENNGTAWTIDDSGTNRLISSTAGNNRYAISYSNNNFALITGTATGNTINPYSIRYQTDNDYMSYSGTELVNSTSETKIWYFTSTTNNTQIYTIINGENYYLNPNNINNNEYMNLSTTNQTNWTWGTSGNYKTLTVQGAGNQTYRRLSYYPSDDEWYLSKNANFNKLTISGTAEYSFTTNLTKTAYDGTIEGPDEALNDSRKTEGMNYTDDDVTYFPLSTVNNTDNFTPDKSNTGYIVSGSNISSSDTNIDSANSIVRFSNLFGLEQWKLGNTTYPKSLSDDFNLTTGEFTNIYTIVKNGNNLVRSSNIANDYTNYTKLKNAKETLGNVMKTANNPNKKAYGVHFMDAAISMNALTTAKYIKVNGKEYTNYQLPVNSIDFHLKEFGYINFIAGTYYRNSSTDRNDSFFSIYQIERLDNSPNTINRILEIKNIYQHTSKNKTYSYVYELSDGNSTIYTKPYIVTSSEGDKEWLYDDQSDWATNQYVNSLPPNYTKVFDVDVIKKNNINGTNQTNDFDYHPFYFEIPMNDGEFCLGSVSGGTGAYLMYLDIAANAAKTNRTIFYEKFTFTQKTYSHPLGVALQPLPTTYTSGVAVININDVVDDSDSACVEIKPTANGNYSMDRDSNNVALTRANTTLAPPIYAGESITLTGTGDLDPVPTSSSSNTIERMQYYDYLINTNTLCVTTFTDYYSTSGTFENRVIEQNRYSGNAVNDNPTSTLVYDPNGILGEVKNDSGDMKIYNTNTGISYTVAEFTNSSTVAISDARLPSTQILEFKFVQDGGDYSDTTTLVVALDTAASQTDTYYKYANYTIVISPNAGTVTVKITDYESTFTISTYNSLTGTTTSGSVSTVITINGTTVTAEGQTIINS